MRGVRWKGSVQMFSNRAVTNIWKLYKQCVNRKITTGKFHFFTIMERGKERHIQSVHIKERIIQRCFCDYCLVPTLSSTFVYDNSACIKGKGMHFALRRLKRKLHRYWINNRSNEFYILQFDFRHYFDTIPHKEIIDMVCQEIEDDDLKALYAQLVNDFDGDYGLGLGSQISQISALFYPHKMDNYFSCKKGIQGYARYMDDGYLIANNKEVLQECLEYFYSFCCLKKLEPNIKKTVISKINGKSFNFLKARTSMLKNGKIVMRPNKRNIYRNNRKFRKMEEQNIDIKAPVQATLGGMLHLNCYKYRRQLRNILYSKMNQPAL